jgi:hypothetical protein
MWCRFNDGWQLCWPSVGQKSRFSADFQEVDSEELVIAIEGDYCHGNESKLEVPFVLSHRYRIRAHKMQGGVRNRPLG